MLADSPERAACRIAQARPKGDTGGESAGQEPVGRSAVRMQGRRARILSYIRSPGLRGTGLAYSRRDLCPEFLRPRREGRQPLALQISARAEQLDPGRREYGEINLVAAPIGTTAV